MNSTDNYILNFLSSNPNYKNVKIVSNSNTNLLSIAIENDTTSNIVNHSEDLTILYYLNYKDICNYIDNNAINVAFIAIDMSSDFFDIWEKCRSKINHFYIIKDKDLNEKSVTEWIKKDTDIELSIIVPIYNVYDYLDECLNSIVAWDAKYIEIILINDGSTDDSQKIIDKYCKIDKRIVVLNKNNGGCASARNMGLEYARGRYVGFVDPDDFIDHKMFKILLGRAVEGCLDISWCGYNDYYNDSKTFTPALDIDIEPYTNPLFYKKDIIHFISIRRIAIWRAIYKKEMLDKNNIRFHENLKRFDDLPFKVETFSVAQSVCAINQNLYYYRLNRFGQDTNTSDDRLFIHFDIFQILDDFICKFNDVKMLRLYEQVKFDTHYWAITKIDGRFLSRYRELAKRDLLKLMTKSEIKTFLLEMGSNYSRKMRKAFKL